MRRGWNPALPVLDASRWARGRTAFRRERALARRDGLWISAGGLRTAFRVPDEENAAVVLMRAVGGAGIGPPMAQDGIQMGRLPPEVWREAASRPYLVFERTWEKPHEALRPELASFKAAGKALIADGDPVSVARLAALMAQEPEVICQYVSLALGKMALRAAPTREVEALLDHPSLRHGLRGMALGLPPPVRPRYRFVGRTALGVLHDQRDTEYPLCVGGTMIPVAPWNRRMVPKAAERFQCGTLRACRRLYRSLGRVDEAEALRRSVAAFRERSHPHPFAVFPLDWVKAHQGAQAFAEYRELRRIAREGP